MEGVGVPQLAALRFRSSRNVVAAVGQIVSVGVGVEVEYLVSLCFVEEEELAINGLRAGRQNAGRRLCCGRVARTMSMNTGVHKQQHNFNAKLAGRRPRESSWNLTPAALEG